ncbi:ATP-binding cassette domain-containing protein [Phenylobacterium sp. J426]|uniref:ABC transporter ATP-binding protein n=1 Tax=Phenylobacterium sp. J426 TaxID=2898439 RepID=UPI002151E9C5|nr:ATP-binding cassette domain-containing protein [Phenylobacterium sp. J426]MCR5876244.1 ATP-binding cassette domain-containing protein [Phenylobacterium sp. J426]
MLIEARNLTHRIADRQILDLPLLQVAAGDHHLLLGPSGSGKTTLINILAGLLTPTTGDVLIDGASMARISPTARDALRREKIGLVFQTLRLISSLTVRQNLALAQRLGPGPVHRELIDRLISQVGLAHRADARPRELSQGETQRAAIARALCTQPPILIADEPTSALDDVNAQAMVDLMLSAARTTGATLIIATHDRRIRGRFPQAIELKPTALAA